MDELNLHRYMDGRLDERERRGVEEALRHDPAARRTLDALREESRLIAGALENQSELSRRLSDKVIAQLHIEERSRVSLLRTRRLFRRAASAAAIAAALVLCFFLVKPRASAGSIVSGSNATVTVHGEKHDAQKGTRLYEGDELATGRGQFVRLELADGSRLDLDENSRLSIERSGSQPQVRLILGRVEVTAAANSEALRVEALELHSEIAPGTQAEIWLPEAAQAQWPSMFYALDHFSNTENSAREVKLDQALAKPELALLTVFKGVARISLSKNSELAPVLEGVRAAVSNSEITRRRVKLSGSRVLELRDAGSLSARDPGNAKALDWVRIGLLSNPEFENMGRKLGLLNNAPSLEQTPARIGEALRQLDGSLRDPSHVQRAEAIAAAQQALRLACEALPKEDTRRGYGLMLEGLAHFEEGRARFMLRNAAGSDARTSFEAARVAFDGALEFGRKPGDTSAEWQAAFAGGATPQLQDLPPQAQASLVAEFKRAAALYWKARASHNEPELARDIDEASAAFLKLHEGLGRSVESLAALLGQALSDELHADDASRSKALDALQILAAKPLTGSEPQARRSFEGVRQSAMLELVRINAQSRDGREGRDGREARKTLDAARDFTLLYPLESRSPAAEAVKLELKSGLENLAAAALKEKRFDHAAEACDALLLALDENDGIHEDSATSEVRHLGVHLDLLEALIGAQDWPRARRELDALDGRMPEELKARFETLRKGVYAGMKK